MKPRFDTKTLDYPCNLIQAIKELHSLSLKQEDDDFDIVFSRDMLPNYGIYKLTENERKVIKLMFEDKMSFSDVAQCLKLTRTRIYQIQVRAIHKICRFCELAYGRSGRGGA